MSWWRRFFLRLSNVCRAGQAEPDLAREIASHLTLLEEDFQRRGMTRDQAQAAARRAFGGVEQTKELHRDARMFVWLDDGRRDLQYAVRALRRTPGFTAVATLTLALGIGANSAIFSMLNAVLLRSLPVAQPDQLVIFSTVNAGGNPSYRFSYHTFSAFHQRSQTLSDVLAVAPLRMSVDADGRHAPTAAGQMVSGNYFSALGVRTALGRPISPDDDGRPGAAPVAVLSYGYWQRQFGGDPSVVGRTIRLNSQPFTVAGVSSPEFFGTHVGDTVDIFVPLSTQPQVNADFGSSLITGVGADDFWLELLGRLRTDVVMRQAQAEADGLFQQMLPDVLARAGRAGPKAKQIGHPHVNLEPGSRGLSELRRRFSQPLRVVMGLVMLVLLIACANVASLLLARATSRQRELAVRVSLGAGRGRVIRQLLTESVLLAALGGGLGLFVVMWSRHSVSVLLAGRQLHVLDVQPDLNVLSFTLTISLLTGLVFGIVPALGASRVEAQTALKGQTHGPIAVGRRFGLRGGLVCAQVAMSVALLVGAGLFVRTLTNLRHLDLGFDEEHVLTLRLEPRGSNQKNQNGLRLMRQYGELLDRVQHVHGVRAASLAGSTPLIDENPLMSSFTVPGHVPRADDDMHVRLVQIYPGYFSAMGIPLLAGRDFRRADNDPDMLRLAGMSSSELQARCHPAAAIINETMARRLFGTAEAAVGRQFNQPSCTFQIVGVARDVRDRAIREEVALLAYAPYAQMPTGRGQMTFIVRASGNPHAFVTMIERLARELDPTMPLPGVETLSDRVVSATEQEHLVAVLASLFGALALALTMVGLYGVLAYAVAQRTREIGIRMALGAARSDVVGIVLGQSAGVTAVGMVLGLAFAAAVTRCLQKMLFGLSPLDPTTFVAVSMVFGLVAMLASYVPARRATRVDPIVALRCE